MSRLIDADELIKYIKIWEIGTSISSDQKEFIDCVSKQLTAFDVDKVVEQLEEVKKIMTSPVTKDCFGEECRASGCTVYLISKAIEIVKGGGVE
jgi:hypothetical protein